MKIRNNSIMKKSVSLKFNENNTSQKWSTSFNIPFKNKEHMSFKIEPKIIKEDSRSLGCETCESKMIRN